MTFIRDDADEISEEFEKSFIPSAILILEGFKEQNRTYLKCMRDLQFFSKRSSTPKSSYALIHTVDISTEYRERGSRVFKFSTR